MEQIPGQDDLALGPGPRARRLCGRARRERPWQRGPGAAGKSTAAITWFAVSAASRQPIANSTLFAVQVSTEPMAVVRSLSRSSALATPLRPGSGVTHDNPARVAAQRMPRESKVVRSPLLTIGRTAAASLMTFARFEL